jgi:uncharacterized membrane protein
MWWLGGVPILIVVIGTGMVAFGAAVSWVAFRTRNAFNVSTTLSVVSLAIAALAWWRGGVEGRSLAPVPFEIAAALTIGAGLVTVLGELARSRRGPDDDDPNWPPT